MKSQLLVVDDFAVDAEQVREQALDGPFTTEKGPDGLDYTGINKAFIPNWTARIERAVGRPIDLKLSFFRMNCENEFPHAWVHSDGIIAKNAGLVYLNPPYQCKGGTAFWHHRGLSIDELPSPAELMNVGMDVQSFYGMVNREWHHLEQWQQVGFVGMKWNRFVTYPTARFHSRYPFEGFGTTPYNSRLVWACFYD